MKIRLLIIAFLWLSFHASARAQYHVLYLDDSNQTDATLTLSGTVTFEVAPVFMDALGTRVALDLGPLATLSPTGTASATTYLRGDGTWATPSSGSVLPVTRAS